MTIGTAAAFLFLSVSQAGNLASAEIRLVHVLKSGCACSERIARQLAGLPGEIRWTGDPETERLRGEHGVPSGPWLLALDRQGASLYSGGHGSQVDPAMLARLAAGQPEPVRRAHACSYSEKETH